MGLFDAFVGTPKHIMFGPKKQTRSNPAKGMAWDPWAMPGEPPKYSPVWSEDLAMSPDVQEALAGVQMDPRGLNRFRSEALRKGPSAWSKLARTQQGMAEQDARANLSAETLGRSAAARSQLAMRGGLDSGARERVASQGQKDYLMGSQGLSRQAQQNEMQIGINDEMNRIQQLSMLPGMDAQAAGLDLNKAQLSLQGRQFDVANQLGDRRAANDWNRDIWGKKMEGWAAGKQADATANAGKK